MTLLVDTDQKHMSKKWLSAFIGLFCLTFLNYILARLSLYPPKENVVTVFWPATTYANLLELSQFALLISCVLVVAYPLYHHRWVESAIIFVATLVTCCSTLWVSTIFPTLSITDTAKINDHSYYLIEVDEPWEFWAYLGFCAGETTSVSCDYFFTAYGYEVPIGRPIIVAGPNGTVQVQWDDQILYRYNGTLPGLCNQQFNESFGHCSSPHPG